MELETRDLLGVRFEGNEEPDPLLLPNELRGAWPLRKDYKIPEEGIELGGKVTSGK
jgi:NADH-quinone oxidoreductase subunit C